jgi:hypothetical protein
MDRKYNVDIREKLRIREINIVTATRNTTIIIIQFNSLFIYVLSSTGGGQLQSQHEV